jgi:hypothetical protein
MVKLWNMAVDMYPESFSYLVDTTKYPELPDEPTELERENVFGI